MTACNAGSVLGAGPGVEVPREDRCVRVTAQRTGRTVTVRVIDRMTHAGTDGGKTRFLDLSPRAFNALGGTEAEGVIPIDFAFVECPGNLQ
jgi:rare lipoprotein A (peptidoglycan hydrolase)